MFHKNFTKQIIKFCLIAVIATSLTGCTSISKDAAGVKAQEYISKHVLKNGIKAKVSDVKDENGFYTVAMQISKDEKVVDKVKVYVTKDGKNLSLGPIFDMSKAPPTPAQAAKDAAEAVPKSDKPKVELFVMAGCPYGLQAEAAFAPVIKALGDKIDFTPHYVVYSDYQGGGPTFCIDKANKFCSMHGAEEAREDVRQICIWNDQRDKWWDYINKFNEKCQINEGTPGCSKEVAKSVGIDYGKVEACLKNDAEKLMAQEADLNKKYNVEGSPSIIINGASFNGNRAPNDILAGICASFKNQPEECSKKLAGGDTAPAAAQGGCGR
jgi:hypothetical protein